MGGLVKNFFKLFKAYLKQESHTHSVNANNILSKAKSINFHSASRLYHHLPMRVVYLILSLNFILYIILGFFVFVNNFLKLCSN